MKNKSPFHLAVPVHNLSIARDFYENILELDHGRSSDQWVDYDFFGHQLVLHEDNKFKGHKHFNEVDGRSVPVPHFGIVLPQCRHTIPSLQSGHLVPHSCYSSTGGVALAKGECVLHATAL